MDISGVDEAEPRITDLPLPFPTSIPSSTPASAAPENPNHRLARIELELLESPDAVPNRADINFLLSVVRHLGDQRILGLREAAGLIRAAKQREVTTRFLVGKKEQTARSMNSKLMDTVANLIEKYAQDAADGNL